MALKHHPDKNPNNPEATEKVSQILPHKLHVTSNNDFMSVFWFKHLFELVGKIIFQKEYAKFFSTFEPLGPS